MTVTSLSSTTAAMSAMSATASAVPTSPSTAPVPTTGALQLEHIADEAVFVHLDITVWSGKRTLTPVDLGLDPATVPPEHLVSWGSLQLIDPQRLRTFASLRSSARRLCRATGVRFLGGFLVHQDRAQALLDGLGRLRAPFEQARSQLASTFDAEATAWVDRQPVQWQPLLRDKLINGHEVAARLRYRVQALQLARPSADQVQHAGLDEAVGGLAGQFYREVSQQAAETLERSYLGRETVGQKALRPVWALHQKLEGLAFLDDRAQPIADALATQLRTLPGSGLIGGESLEALRSFLQLAEQPSRLMAHGTRLRDGTRGQGSVTGALFEPRPVMSSLSALAVNEDRTDSVPVVETVTASRGNAAVADRDDMDAGDAGADVESDAGDDDGWTY